MFDETMLLKNFLHVHKKVLINFMQKQVFHKVFKISRFWQKEIQIIFKCMTNLVVTSINIYPACYDH